MWRFAFFILVQSICEDVPDLVPLGIQSGQLSHDLNVIILDIEIMLDSGNGPVRIWTFEQDELIACLNWPSPDDTIVSACPESFLAESRQVFLLEPVIQLVAWLSWQTHLRNQIGPDTDSIANTSIPLLCSASYQVLTESSNAEEVGTA